MSCRTLRIIVSTSLFMASACAGADANVATGELVAAEPYHIALQAGTSVGSEDIDGFCENGAGVYLSTKDGVAELTLYVVTPAETVTFEPALRLTSQHGEERTTEVRQLESVTLESGESRLFSEPVDGTLMVAVAEIAAR